jgi:hypothetical protein
MPQVSAREFERLPLRVPEFLNGVPLHDVWAVGVPLTRAGITLDELYARQRIVPSLRLCWFACCSISVSSLDGIFGWDSELGAGACETFAMSDGTEAHQTELTN